MGVSLSRWEDRQLAKMDASAKARQFGGMSFDDYLGLTSWSFGGNEYTAAVNTTWPSHKSEPMSTEFTQMVRRAYKGNGIIAACVTARAMVFSEIEFTWRRFRDGGLWSDDGLSTLERPSPTQTTGEFLFRMEQDVSLTGNWYGIRRMDGSIKRLRPDWVETVLTSNLDPMTPGWQADATVLGFRYYPGGKAADGGAVGGEPMIFNADQVAHWSPLPDPEWEFRGMSWLTPVLREIEADIGYTEHKGRFVDNAGTPNLVIIAPESVRNAEQFKDFRRAIEGDTTGRWNAYRNLYLAAGADVRPVGLDMKQLDFKATQGAGETRIAAASRVPAVILGISEGLQGSTLNQGNYAMARRLWADAFLRPHWRSATAALETLVPVPQGSRLWYREDAVAFLREDADAAANILQTNAATIRQLVDGGYEPSSVVEAVDLQDLTRLVHTGKLSVQLQEPGAEMADTLVEPSADDVDRMRAEVPDAALEALVKALAAFLQASKTTTKGVGFQGPPD